VEEKHYNQIVKKPFNAQKEIITQKLDHILGVKISSSSQDDLLKAIEKWLIEKRHFLIVTPNPEIVLMSQSNELLRNALNSADISLPDGIGLVFAAKFLRNSHMRRIQGRKFMVSLLGQLNKMGGKVYFVGSTDAVIQSVLERVSQDFPHVHAKGTSGPLLSRNGKPIDKVSENRETAALNEITSFKPNIVFVGFGAPKQELWSAKHRNIFSKSGVMVVGGSLDTYSGHVSHPPVLFEQLGIEWLWRFIHEPKRLIRILNAVFVFPLFVVKAKIESVLYR